MEGAIVLDRCVFTGQFLVRAPKEGQEPYGFFNHKEQADSYAALLRLAQGMRGRQ